MGPGHAGDAPQRGLPAAAAVKSGARSRLCLVWQTEHADVTAQVYRWVKPPKLETLRVCF